MLTKYQVTLLRRSVPVLALVIIVLVACSPTLEKTPTPTVADINVTPTELSPTTTSKPTNTSTPTETPAPTETPTPTDTPVPTETPTPTDTPTDTPASTKTPTPTETPAPTETPVPQPVETAFNVNVRIESGKVYFDVLTNLPDSMQFMFTVADSEGGIEGQAKAEIANGAMSVGPFSKKGEPYPPGKYIISISSPLLRLQPPEVQKAMGESGENVYGEYIFEGRVDYEKPFVVKEQLSSPEGREVTKEEFGEDWPFTVERGFVDCTNLSGGLREAVFRSGGVTYALNGTARPRAEAHGYEDVMESSVWRDDPNYPGLKIDIGPILALALQECD